METDELALLEDALRGAMAGATGETLEQALDGLGWREMLAQAPRDTVPVVFRLLGETGAHAPLLNDVVLLAAGREPGGTAGLPYAGDRWVEWRRGGDRDGGLDPDLPLHGVESGDGSPLAAGRQHDAAGTGALAAGRRALGWWLLGTGHAMLTLAGRHVLERTQFGRPLATFQALRHKLAETLVALDGAEAALAAAEDDAGELTALLGKAAAGQAALTAARHCQQALGGIGFTAEHDLHRHIRRAVVLDGLLGSARELTREAGRQLAGAGRAPRLVDL